MRSSAELSNSVEGTESVWCSALILLASISTWAVNTILSVLEVMKVGNSHYQSGFGSKDVLLC